jgi:hypothetical protein
LPANAFWHRQQAALLRGLPGKQVRCSFADSGFLNRDGTRAVPCLSSYHCDCFRVGPPFTSRRQGGKDLSLPKLDVWPSFICEACTVRAILDRELTGPDDRKLLCFDRIRILDLVHFWSAGTTSTYQSKLKVVDLFDATYDLPATTGRILRRTRLERHHTGPEIPLQWLQESYSLRLMKGRDGDLHPLSFETTRQLRSAGSQFYAWESLCAGTPAHFDPQRRLLLQASRPAGSFSYTLFTGGMGARIGEDSKPSIALMDSQVRFIMHDLDQRYSLARDPVLRRELALVHYATI